MKKIISVIMLVGRLLTACDTTSSDNGELDGMWYLTKVDTLSNGHSVDYRSNRVFWSFQGTLAQFTYGDGENHYYMSRFDHNASRLKLSGLFFYNRSEGDRILDSETLDEVRPFGINNLNEDYMVKSLDEDKMILQDEELCLHFEKY